MQAVVAVPAGVVFAVGLPRAALGGDEGAVNQDHLPTLPDDLLERAVQARGLCGEQSDRLVAPAPDGGLGDVVATGHVGQALVVAQYGQDDHRDLPGRQDPPPGPDSLQMAPQQTGEVVDGARGQWQTAPVDNRAGVLFGSLHTVPNGRQRHRGYVRAAPFRAALVGLAPSADSS